MDGWMNGWINLTTPFTIGMLEDQHRRERVQMQEEATNTAIIQETEEELQQINTSLYKVPTVECISILQVYYDSTHINRVTKSYDKKILYTVVQNSRFMAPPPPPPVYTPPPPCRVILFAMLCLGLQYFCLIRYGFVCFCCVFLLFCPGEKQVDFCRWPPSWFRAIGYWNVYFDSPMTGSVTLLCPPPLYLYSDSSLVFL